MFLHCFRMKLNSACSICEWNPLFREDILARSKTVIIGVVACHQHLSQTPTPQLFSEKSTSPVIFRTSAFIHLHGLYSSAFLLVYICMREIKTAAELLVAVSSLANCCSFLLS
uniref:Uncharacterized protein n=1 Tax=Parascaris univalens TaxID=6257 RepID=A0A915CEJ7_PARUN